MKLFAPPPPLANTARFDAVRILLLSFFIVLGSFTTFGQTIECLAKDRTDSPPPIGYRNQPLSSMDWKCVKVKFHILDNDGLPITDQQIYDRLQEINRYFEPGQIRLVLYDACIQRLQVSDTVSAADIYSSLAAADSLYDYDDSAVNIYVLNSNTVCNSASASYDNDTTSFRFAFHCSWNQTPQLFAHEIGHVIGNLGHTFAVDTYLDQQTGELTYLNVECKDGTNCQTAGDYICQTGADPYVMDLNDNNIQDAFEPILWINPATCQDTLTNSRGECQPYDTITSWDVPVKNLMSYYSCSEEFVDEQYLEMHMKLDNDPEVFKFTIDCGDLDFQRPPSLKDSLNITISNKQIWSDTTVEMYPGQKIIITENGFLVLDNTTLTLGESEYNRFCQDSTHIEDYWDGIYIEGGDATTSIVHGPGGPVQVGPKGAINILNNSIVDFSANGIQAKNNFGGVLLKDSYLAHNLQAMDVNEDRIGGAGGECDYATSKGRVVIDNSEITINNPQSSNSPKLSHIVVDGTSTSITKSTINNLTGATITAVKSGKGELVIEENSVISNFTTGVYKELDRADICDSRGLKLENSAIINCTHAIRNRSQYARVIHNYIDGKIDISGLGYSRWEKNNIKGGIKINDPQEGCYWNENIFDIDNNVEYVSIINRNLITNFSCNTWDSNNDIIYAVIADAPSLPLGWGTFTKSSGNRHINSPPGDSTENFPILISTQVMITNFEYQTDSAQLFNYESDFVVGAAFSTSLCNYTSFPTDTSGIGGEQNNIDLQSIDSLWQYWTNYIEKVTDSLEMASGQDSIDWTNELDYALSQRSIVLGNALIEIDTQYTSEYFNLWLDRGNSKLREIDSLLFYLQVNQIDDLMSYSNNLSATVSNEDLSDLNILDSFVNLIKLYVENGNDLHELDNNKLDSIVLLAQSSFGDYTNVIRQFLNIEYDIIVNQDQTAYSSVQSPKTTKQDLKRDYTYTHKPILYPNPTGNCFKLALGDFGKQPVIVSIYSIAGRRVLHKTIQQNEEICVGDLLSKGIYIVKVHVSDNSDNINLKLFIN